MYVAGVAILLVAAVILLEMPSANANTGTFVMDNLQVNASIMSRLQLPQSLLSDIGIGAARNFPVKLNSSTQLAVNGKPQILYIGAEYCPFCAAERWAMVMALMRFGNFTTLHFITSSPSDAAAPSIPSFTFYNSTYNSQYVNFTAFELTRNIFENGTYPRLQNLSSAYQSIIAGTDPQQSIPYINFANASVMVGSNLDPTLMSAQDWNYVLDQAYTNSTPLSQQLVGATNLITAQICKLTNNTPSNVCSAPYITSIESNYLK